MTDKHWPIEDKLAGMVEVAREYWEPPSEQLIRTLERTIDALKKIERGAHHPECTLCSDCECMACGGEAPANVHRCILCPELIARDALEMK